VSASRSFAASDEIRAYLADQLNLALRRPGMFGTDSEPALRMLMDHLLIVECLPEALAEQQHVRDERGARSLPKGRRERAPGAREDPAASAGPGGIGPAPGGRGRHRRRQERRRGDDRRRVQPAGQPPHHAGPREALPPARAEENTDVAIR
jgi:hypothetical protein